MHKIDKKISKAKSHNRAIFKQFAAETIRFLQVAFKRVAKLRFRSVFKPLKPSQERLLHKTNLARVVGRADNSAIFPSPTELCETGKIAATRTHALKQRTQTYLSQKVRQTNAVNCTHTPKVTHIKTKCKTKSLRSKAPLRLYRYDRFTVPQASARQVPACSSP